eukprot:11214880-Alexandrium_andersonii.AAC.1
MSLKAPATQVVEAVRGIWSLHVMQRESLTEDTVSRQIQGLRLALNNARLQSGASVVAREMLADQCVDILAPYLEWLYERATPAYQQA